MNTDVTITDNSGIATHHIDFRGVAGVCFYSIVVAIVLYLIAFFTEGWVELENQGGSHQKIGLWKTCTCDDASKLAYLDHQWVKASQAVFVLAFLGLLVVCVLAVLYMFVHRVNKNQVLLGLVCTLFISVLLLIIGLSIYGSKSSEQFSNIKGFTQGFSFAFTVLSTLLCLVAGALALTQLIRSRRDGGMAATAARTTTTTTSSVTHVTSGSAHM